MHDTTKDIHAIAIGTSENVAQLSSAMRNEGMRKWLRPSDPLINYHKALQERHPGTGQWLLRDHRYLRWMEQPTSFLWLYGIPGCGKTVLSTTAIASLKEHANEQAVLYFYFTFSDVQKQGLDYAIRALAHQLYHTGHADVREPLDTCFASHKRGQQQPSLEVLSKTFQEMVKKAAGKLWIVLDALDECSPKKQERLQLLEWIHGIHAACSNVHLLVTSRPEHDIKSALEGWESVGQFIPLQSELVQKDISSYVRWEVEKGNRLKRWHGQKDVQQEIIDTLAEKAQGM